MTLASGLSMPRLALGTWKSPPGQTAAAVKAAIRCGYRFIDAANDYANEHEVGAALRELMEAGEVKREELFVQVGFLMTCQRSHRRNCGTRITDANT